MPNKVNKRMVWTFGESVQPLDKGVLIDHYISTMFARTSRMFTYENLPDTMRERDIEYLIQYHGYGVGVKHEGKPYLLFGTMSGKLNEQYLPTQAIVTNPYLNLTKTYTIGKDCIIWKNDSSFNGLLTMANKYATLLAETDISMKYGAINSRILTLISATDDATKESAEHVLKKIFDGEDLGIITTKPMLESLKAYPYGGSTNNYIKELLELHQYIKANWYIDLGINANYNMKRESLSSNEVAVNEDTLLPLIDDMLACREKAVEQFNEMFGTNIVVKLNSVWEKIDNEVELQQELMEKEVETLDKEPDEEQPKEQEEKEDEDKRDE